MKRRLSEDKLVLVRPGIRLKGEIHWSKFPPLGLGYLASCCEKESIPTYVVDGKLERHSSTSATIEKILSYNSRFIGISALTIEYSQAFDIATKLKSISKDFIIILGGAHANALNNEIINATNVFDFVFTGEAEHVLPILMKDIIQHDGLTESIPGVFSKNIEPYKYNNSISQNTIEDLNSIPFPAWDKFQRTDIYPILTQRGCPYECVFCSHNSGYRIRDRSIEDVMRELEWLHISFSPKEIHFEDETFGINKNRTYELLNELILFNRKVNTKFKAQTRANIINKEIVKMMKEAGFNIISIGVESGDDKILNNINKAITTNQVKESVAIIKGYGIKIQCFFILGLPGETKKSIRNSQNLAINLNPNKLSVSIVTPYPGTKIYNWAKDGKNGYKLSNDVWSNYDKYMGNGISINGLSNTYLKIKQVETYLKVYIINIRIKELFYLITQNYSLLFSFIKSFFKS